FHAASISIDNHAVNVKATDVVRDYMKTLGFDQARHSTKLYGMALLQRCSPSQDPSKAIQYETTRMGLGSSCREPIYPARFRAYWYLPHWQADRQHSTDLGSR